MVDHLIVVDNDFDAFTRLAEQWRDEHPAEVLLARPMNGYELQNFGTSAKIIEALQNRYNRWKQVIDAVRQQGGVVSEAADFYRAEERYWGKVASRIEDFHEQVGDFIKQVQSTGLQLVDVQLYAYAKHAKERNAYMRTLRAEGRDGFDSWSGMTDGEADEILQAAKDEGHEAVLERRAERRGRLLDLVGVVGRLLDEALHDADTRLEDLLELVGRELEFDVVHGGIPSRHTSAARAP